MIGKTISHYRIIEELGRGGMGIVYLAEDTKLGRKIALKVLAEDVAAHHDRVRRFTREAQAASAINHPNIATIYEIDEVDGLTFIAMEFVEGKTLRARIAAGIPSFDEILDLSRQIARALGKAHELSIVHRDIKPENIVVRPDGLVKVLDFGLAKLIQEPECIDATRSMALTREGAVMGTARYMSPEQACGTPVDARADVFAVGSVFYEMVTGQPAFQGDSQIDVLYAIVNTPAEPIPDDAGVPEEYREVVARALSKDPSHRFDNCGALAEALETHQATDMRSTARRLTPAKPRSTVTRRRWIVPAMTLALVAALAIIGSQWWWTDDGSPDYADLTYTPLTGDGHSRSSAISPDGMYLAYTPMDGEESGLYLKQIDTGSESVLIPRARHGIRSPVFSPDGSHVYYAMTGPTFSMSAAAEYDLYRISMLGGEPQRVASRIIGRRFAVSSDGSRLAYKRTVGDSTQVLIAEANGTGEQLVASEPINLTVDCCVAWSANGDAIVSTTRDTISGSVSIVALPLDGSAARPASDWLWQAVLDLRTLADGSGLLVVGCPVSDEKTLNINLWHVASAGGEPRQITNDITNYYQVSSSAAGDKLALTFYAAKRTLRVLDVSSGEHRDVSTDIVAKGRVEWARSGQLIANQRVGNRIGIVAVSPSTGVASQVASDVDYVSELDVSPDGSQVVFTSFEGSENSLWQVERDGGVLRRLTAGEGDEMDARYSPDGRWLAAMYRATADVPWIIRRRELGTDDARALTEVSGRWPRISPDGTQIAAYFLDTDQSQFRLALIPSDGGSPDFLELSAPYRLLDWSPDGSALTCYRRDGGTMLIDDVPLDGGEPRQIAEIPAGSLGITDADWNAAGDSLAVCLQSATFDVMLVQGSGSGGVRPTRPPRSDD